MQLRRAVPLSFVALLAGAGCVSVGPGVPAVPARGPVPPAGAREAAPPAPPAQSRALPLGRLPDPEPAGEPDRYGARDQDGEPRQDGAPGPDEARHSDRLPGRALRPPAARGVKTPSAPRRGHSPKPDPHRTGHHSAPAPDMAGTAWGMDDLCAAAEGTVPPSVVDLCVRQYGR
ncbi:hypothetical protein AB0B01_17910 [Streptomyces sp. NPDC044571]|uniref:hypothetical protein n=1 Tax=Streptomyces sp. NPDC044571 TaxID=3155371 RepID=UPI0033C11380